MSAQELSQACHCNRVCTRTHTSYLEDGDDPEAAGLRLVAATEQLLHGDDDLILGGGQEAPVGGSACEADHCQTTEGTVARSKDREREWATR